MYTLVFWSKFWPPLRIPQVTSLSDQCSWTTTACRTPIYSLKVGRNEARLPFGQSGCWKNSPYVSKICPKISNSSFYLRVLFSKPPKSQQIFGLLFQENMSPRTFKNRPIWSHWSYVQQEQFYLQNLWRFDFSNFQSTPAWQKVDNFLQISREKFAYARVPRNFTFNCN